jgi:DNA-binding transcriptional regulator YiaG
MADDRTPISPEKLKQVLDRLNAVLSEAARLRAEVMRQLTEQCAAAQQHLSPRKRKTARHER